MCHSAGVNEIARKSTIKIIFTQKLAMRKNADMLIFVVGVWKWFPNEVPCPNDREQACGDLGMVSQWLVNRRRGEFALILWVGLWLLLFPILSTPALSADPMPVGVQHEHSLSADNEAEAAKPAEIKLVDITPKNKGGKVDFYGDPLPPAAIARLGTIRLWGCRHPGEVHFSDDWKTAVGVSANTINVWDISTDDQKRIAVFKLPIFAIENSALSADGHLLAINTENRFAIFDLIDRTTVAVIPKEARMSVLAITADKRTVIAYDDKTINQIDIATKITTNRWPFNGSACCYCSSTNILAYAPQSASLVLKSMSQAGVTREFSRAGFDIQRLAFSPDGRHIAVESNVTPTSNNEHCPSQINVLDCATGADVAQVNIHEWLWPIAISKNGELGCFSTFGEITVKQMITGRTLHKMHSIDSLECCSFSKDGRAIALSAREGVMSVDTSMWKLRKEAFPAFDQAMILNDEKRAITWLRNTPGSCSMWNVQSGRLLWNDDGARRLKVVKDQDRGGSDDIYSRVWNPHFDFNQTHFITQWSLSKVDGEQVRTHIVLQDSQSGQILWKETSEDIQLAFFCPTNSIFAVIHDHFVSLHNSQTGAILRRLEVPSMKSVSKRTVDTLGRFSSDGKVLFVTTPRGIVEFEVSTGKIRDQFAIAFDDSATYSNLSVILKQSQIGVIEHKGSPVTRNYVIWDRTSGKEIFRYPLASKAIVSEANDELRIVSDAKDAMGGSLVEIRMAKHLGGVRRIDVPEPSVYSWFLSLDGNRVLIDSIVETEDASTHNLQTYDLSLERVISKDRRKGIFEYIGGSPKLNLYVSEESEGALVQENIGRIDGIPK